MIFSKKCEYAIKALIHLCIHSDEDTKLNITDISDSIHSPMHFTSKILQELARHKIVSSSKGLGGGFYLNNSQKNVPIRDVIDIIDGKELLSQCGLGLKKCSSVNPCPIHNEFVKYSEQLKQALANKSISVLSLGVAKGTSFIINQNEEILKIGQKSPIR
jgi:Rrf2 family protein